MIKRIVEKLRARSKLVENYFFLMILQGFDYLVPLITLPYLTRVLGVEIYGLVAFAQALIQYVIMFTDYGFGLSATRDVARSKQDQATINEIWSAVFYIKSGIFVLCGLALLAVVEFVPRFSAERWVYYVLFFSVYGNILFPSWLFQGMENMKQVTVRNGVAKIFFVLLMFFFIRNQADYLWFPILTALGSLIAGGIGYVMARRIYGIRFVRLSFAQIQEHLNRGWHVFLTMILASVYGASGTLILGLMTNNTVVGYYAVAVRIVMASQGIVRPMQQAIYPYFGRTFQQDRAKAVVRLTKFVSLMVMFGVSIALGIAIFSGPLVKLLSGEKYVNAIPLVQVLSFTCFTYIVNNAIAIQGFMNFDLSHLVSRLAFRGMVIHLLLAPVLIYFFQGMGLACSLVFVEGTVVACNFYYLQKYIIRPARAAKEAISA